MNNIKIEDRKPIKEFLHKLHNRLEDIMFSIFQKLPERFIPHWLMSWLNHYTDKRIQELKQQIIKDRWRQNALERTLSNIHSQQHKEKAPSDD